MRTSKTRTGRPWWLRRQSHVKSEAALSEPEHAPTMRKRPKNKMMMRNRGRVRAAVTGREVHARAASGTVM
jgi:hypothetical protein